METVRRFRHPLTGEIEERSFAPAALARGMDGNPWLALAVIVLLAVTLVGGSYAVRLYARWSQAQAAIKAAQSKVEYEPLSTVNDGTYVETPAENARAIGVLRRLRLRRQ